ncbi:hypothetical protein WIW50_05835 [Flavobacteriaceae bacterium 3-367]|uniref:hypothetical protein n=1 Tax=Eudoraea algarum TaxID=3417568 RepID=UPI0032942B77
MKKAFSNYGIKLSSVFCNLFGHHYAVSKKVTLHIKEYKCIHCNKQVTTDVSGSLSALTPELQDINDTLENLYQKRHRAAPQQVA